MAWINAATLCFETRAQPPVRSRMLDGVGGGPGNRAPIPIGMVIGISIVDPIEQFKTVE